MVINVDCLKRFHGDHSETRKFPGNHMIVRSSAFLWDEEVWRAVKYCSARWEYVWVRVVKSFQEIR